MLDSPLSGSIQSRYCPGGSTCHMEGGGGGERIQSPMNSNEFDAQPVI